MTDNYTDFDGQMTNTLIVVEREKSTGDWKGSITVVQGRLPPEGKWENRKVEFVSVHKSPEVVAGDLIHTLSHYLESCDGSLFNIERGEINGKADSDEITQ